MLPLSASLSPAVADLGLGRMLGEQVSDETEEMRKKRMQQMQMNQTMGPQASLAVQTIFGNSNALV